VNVKEAKRKAFGTTPCDSLEEWHSAWQWLYDNRIELEDADKDYLDKVLMTPSVLLQLQRTPLEQVHLIQTVRASSRNATERLESTSARAKALDQIWITSTRISTVKRKQ
jgi:hypothetical protein